MSLDERIRRLVEEGGGRAPVEDVLRDALGVAGAAGPLARKLVEAAVRESRDLSLDGDAVVLSAPRPAGPVRLAALAFPRLPAATALPPAAAWTTVPPGPVTEVDLAGGGWRPAAARLARDLAGCQVLVLSATAARRVLRFGALAADLDADSEPTAISLARIARNLGQPLKDTDAAAAMAGVPVPEELAGSCLLVARLGERLAEIAGVSLADLPAVAERDVPAFDYGDRSFGRGDVLALPEAPGVYLFEDADGGVVYVGKARDLRRRVASYFGPTVDERAGRIRDAAFGLAFERTGSELTALLRESVLIEELAPGMNVQEEIRPTGGRGSDRPGLPEAFAVVQPSAEGGVEIVLAAGARGVAVVEVLPHDDGAARPLSSAVAELRSRARAPRPGEAEIVRRWLAGRGDAATVVPADGPADEVVARLLGVARDPDLGQGRIVAVS